MNNAPYRVRQDGSWQSRGDAKSATQRALSGSRQPLLAQVAAGDPVAVRQCIVEYGPLVWSIARRFASTRVEAEDAVEEIFLELWKRVGRYDPALASEPAFVAMLARRRMLERRPDQRRPRIRPSSEDFAGLERAGLERCPEAALAASVLANLDPPQRRVVSLAVGQGMSHAELAQASDMPLASVKSLVRRALVAVRKRLLARGVEP
ncbi:MAG: sigma-70 family RNA polymerase sigma factor [Enhygromyxa sp.]